MTCVRLAGTPTSWGVDYADEPTNPPWEMVLDQAGEAGYGWLELGPLGYLPTDAATVTSALEARGLKTPGTFLFEPFHDPDEREAILAKAERVCSLIAGTGGSQIVLVDHLVAERTRTAGNGSAAPRLNDDSFAAFVHVIAEVSAVAARHGVRALLHPHVGSYVEFADEIERTLDALAPKVVGVCLDTGHAAYAGLDPVQLFASYEGRIEALHLKDIRLDIRARALELGLDFDSAVGTGVFCPIGEGSVDFAALAAALERSDFRGVATIEQDRDPSACSDPVADAKASRSYLASVGIHDCGEEDMR